MVLTPSSLSCSLVAGDGAFKTEVWPEAEVGKAMTSRTLGSPKMAMRNLSSPGAMPPWGGTPYLKAVNMCSNSCFCALVKPIRSNIFS